MSAVKPAEQKSFRQSMAWLHTWTGLLVGWLLLLIFMAGTASYYREEISRWMRPELSRATVDDATAARNAVAFLHQRAPRAESWNLSLPNPRTPTLSLFWRNRESSLPPLKDGERRNRRDLFGDAVLDADSGREVIARDTRGGDFFYRLHFDLHYLPAIWARYIVGFCAMFMLVAIITGVITHKKIFKDFFTFRPGKGQRSWLDFHNVSAVMALPYHAMITYTGIVTLMFLYLPWGVRAAYPGDEERFYAEAFAEIGEPRAAAGVRAGAYPIDRIVEDARRQWQGARIGSVIVHHPGDAASVVDVYRHTGKRLAVDTPSLRFDGVSGETIAASPPAAAATTTRGVMYGLHLARFAGGGLRLLFFVSGLIGCLMVASGVVLWAIKERPKHLKAGRIGFGLRLVDALNIGAVAGLPIAFAAYFWGNRLLPLSLAERAQAEAHVFFIAWACALLAAFVWPRRRMWSWQLYLGGALFALLPLLNALTTKIHVFATIAAGDWGLAGVDLIAFALGLCLFYSGWRMQRWQPPLSAAEKRRQSAAAAGAAGAAA